MTDETKPEFAISKEGHLFRDKYANLQELESDEQRAAVELVVLGDEDGNLYDLHSALKKVGLDWSRKTRAGICGITSAFESSC
jgi:hypothetical protein